MRHKLKQPVPVSAIVELLGAEVKDVSGPMDREIWGVDELPSPAAHSLAFCKFNDQRLDAAARTNAAALIVPTGRLLAVSGPTLLFSDNPRLAFIRAAAWLYKEEPKPGIHTTALIHESARVHPLAEIGPYVVIGPDCSVGPHTVIGPKVVLHWNVHIGRGCKIAAGAVIGEAGFGFERAATGELINFMHGGGVLIGDDVDIGANCCIDRGTLHDTVIADGCRIDNLTHISHNVRMDKYAVVISNVTICGSVHLGERSWVAPNAVVKNQLKIGKDAVVGLGAVVVRDVADGETVAGNPAKPIKPKH